MPLVLVPLIGAEPVVPIIAISSIFTNLSRFVVAFLRYADRRRALIVMAAACLTTALGAYGYTRLTNAGAALVIGTMLILSVPLRRLLKRRDVKGRRYRPCGRRRRLRRRGRRHLRSGVILLSLLMGGRPRGRRRDRDRRRDFGRDQHHQDFRIWPRRASSPRKVTAFAVLIGAVALPGAFLAKAFV